MISSARIKDYLEGYRLLPVEGHESFFGMFEDRDLLIELGQGGAL